MPENNVKKQFAKLVKMRRLGFFIGTMPLVLALLWLSMRQPRQNNMVADKVLISVGVVAIISSLVGVMIMAIYWRCPECKRQLPRGSSSSVIVCPYCSTRLQ